jgi:hypothetical protein
MSRLPLEKQFIHTMFCKQVETIDLHTAKKLLMELHFLYLAQQATFVQLAKQEFKP